MGETEKFKDLKIGTKFITFPIDGDNSGHGGYLGSHYIFIKFAGNKKTKYSLVSGNSIRLKDGNVSAMTDEMKVIIVE